ncbi:MAG: PKD repeat protein [Salibacteraceae bacterium]|jgi:PKD repeat protein
MLFLFGVNSWATHISGADFNYQCIGQDSFYVTLNLFRDCTGISAPNRASVDFFSSCGQTFNVNLTKQNGINGTEISQLCPGSLNQSTCSGGPMPGMQQHIYAGIIVLSPQCNFWTMQWSLCCRNNTVNLVGQPQMMVQATLYSSNDSCNSSPIFNAQPILYVCLNQNVDYNFAVTEPDGDSLVYTFVDPLDQMVAGIAQTVPFTAGYNSQQPIPGITLSTSTGQLQFTPLIQGNFVLAVEVCEYEYGTGILQGCVIRDIQFVVIPCSNQAPIPPPTGISSFTGSGALVANDSVLVCIGNSFNFTIVYTDMDIADSVTLITNISQVIPGATYTIINGNPAIVTVSGVVTASMPTLNSFIVNAIDDACPIPATASSSYNIIVQPLPIVNAGIGQIICKDDVPVTISGSVVNASGGVWSGAGTFGSVAAQLQNTYFPTAAELATGSASVTLTSTGNQNCDPVSDTLLLALVSFNTVLSTSTVDVTCNGGSDGIGAIAYPINSTPNSISWNSNPVQFGDSATNLSSGSYVAILIDSNGCDTSITVVIAEPMVLSTTVIVNSNVNCTGGNDGQATLQAIGGVSPYSYSWSASAQSQTTAIGLNLFAGSHSVTVTDSKGCIVIQNIVITQPNYPMNITVNTTHVSCFGFNDGTATAIATGGTIPYNYNWAPNGQTTNPIVNLPSGTYSITVTDNSGMCVVKTGIIVNQPQPISIQNTSTDILCKGDNTATASVNPTGGTTPFTYQWSVNAGSSNANSVPNLAFGAYSVSLTDGNGCLFDTTINLQEPSPISVTSLATIVMCNSGNNGSANVTPMGGVPPYTVSWNTAPVQTGDTAINLMAGNYLATIIDSNGCDTAFSVTVGEPPVLTGSIVSQTDVTCTGGFNGDATISGVGGVVPYTYVWSTNTGGQTTAFVDSLFAGSYSVTITDSLGCTFIQSINITQPTFALTVNVSTTNITCNGRIDGTATAITVGGTAPYQYSWTPSGQSGSAITNLPVSINTVTVVDNSGQCIVQTGIAISQPDPISTVANITDVSCHLGANGQAQISTSGGVQPFTFIWDVNANAQTDSLATMLLAGSYSFSVTDSNGCNYDSSIVMNQPNPILLSPNMSMPLCYGGSDGQIDVSSIGGTSPYTYLWGGNAAFQTDSIAHMLTMGAYSITVTDSNLCTQESIFMLLEPAPVTANPIQLNPVGCYGDSTGTANVFGSGGTSPYGYQWNTSSKLEPSGGVQGLWAGSYTVTITDTNGCVFDTSIIITQPLNPISLATQITNVACFGDSTGAVECVPTGGTFPYLYLWDSLASNQTNAIATNLAQGFYQVLVTDTNGCQDSIYANVWEPTLALSSVISVTEVLCYNEASGTAVASGVGGTSPYAYQWDALANNQVTDTVNNLAAGMYALTITDSNNCVTDSMVQIGQPVEFVFDTGTMTQVSCYDGANGEASVTVSGGVSPYLFAWSNSANNQTTANAIGLIAGPHLVAVTDSNGCVLNRTFVITQPNFPLDIDSSMIPISCNSGTDGIAIALANGGTYPYSYYWSGFMTTTDTVRNLPTGLYSVQVTDSLGCTDSTSVFVSQPNTLVVSEVENSSVNCFGAADGSAMVNVTGGVAPYQVLWPSSANYQTDTLAINLSQGIYVVTVTDTNNCVTNTSITITQPLMALANLMYENNALCQGDTNGWAAALTTGGTSPYSYQWSYGTPNSLGDTASLLPQGMYTVTVTDSNLCQTISAFQITQPVLLGFSSWSSQAVLCAGGTTGLASVLGSGGTTPYTYAWGIASGLQTTATAIGLSTGNYLVTLTDSNGCLLDTTVFVTEPTDSLLISAVRSSINCYAGTDGNITATVVGGTSPYSIQWGANTGSQTGQIANNLSAGNYNASVTDYNGCLATVAITLTQPNAAISMQSTFTNVTCFGYSDGIASVSGSGGTLPYTIQWDAASSLQSGPNAVSLMEGTYMAYIIDANGCQDSIGVYVGQPSPITVQSSPDDTVCVQSNFNLDVQAFGGNGGYVFSWNNGLSNSASHVTTTINSNMYTVSVTDALGCPEGMDTIHITVYNLNQDSLTIWKDGDICEGESTNLYASYNGNFGSYGFQWSNGLGTGVGPISVSPTQTTIYQVTLTDQCQSTLTDFVIVNVLQSPVVNIPEIIAAGCGPLEVLFEDQVSDAENFSYSWNFGDGTFSNSENPIHVFTNPGSYAITVVKTNIFGCSGTQTGPSRVTVYPTPTAYGVPNTYVTDITSSTIQFTDMSTGANFVRWDFSVLDFSTDLTPSYTYPDTGVYAVLLSVSNQFGCESQYPFQVEVTNENKLNIPDAFIPNSEGGSGGTYDATSLSNEIFYARLAAVDKFHMTIHNRWGELLFESFEVEIGWDGYYRGELSAQDVYVWKIDVVFEDGQQVSEVGSLTLIQ